MAPENDSVRADHFAFPGQLRIGLHVHIDLPWTHHPFTLSNFKITSDQQIRDLRSLGVARFRYDPALSDARPDCLEPVAAIRTAAPPAVGGVAAGRPADATTPAEPAMAEKLARVRELREQRRVVARTEQAYNKAAAVVHRLNRSLLERPGETLEEMDALVGQMVSQFLDRPELTLQFLGDACVAEGLHYHGLNVSVLCLMLARELDYTPEQARLLGAGALLHDLGLVDIPAGILRKPAGEYTRPERELRAMHVEYGVRLGRVLQVAPEVLSIIAQHHEMADGSGYPEGLALAQITPLARIVSLVNFYDNLCNPADPAHGLTPHEALSFIFSRRRTKFDAEVLQLMIRSLGVYPPGSIVKLSNEAIAMVVSVNPKKALRPWVLLYDAAAPREEAIMFNLDTESGLRIEKAIRPALLPPSVYAYLSPRKRITYYFDTGASGAGETA